MITTSTSPGTYLNLALYGFALLGLEIVLLLVEPVLPFTSGSVEAAIAHWVLTITVWAGGSIALLTWARRRTDFFSRGAKARTRSALARWLAIVVIVASTLAAQYALQGAVPLVAEHAALSERFGSAGTLAWIVQVIYYVAEVAVTAVIIGFGQRAGEGWFPPHMDTLGRHLPRPDVGAHPRPHPRPGDRCLRGSAVADDGHCLSPHRQTTRHRLPDPSRALHPLTPTVANNPPHPSLTDNR